MATSDTERPGRFHLLQGAEVGAPAVHARLVAGPGVEVLVGACAYAGALCGENAFVAGLDGAPGASFAGLLLAAPGAAARVGGGVLEVLCVDADGVEAALVVGVAPVNAGPVVRAALGGLLCAVAALEAVLEDVESERTAATTPPARMPAAADPADVLARLARPTVVKGEPITRHPAYKSAALAPPQDTANRAYAQAEAAAALRDAVRAQRAARKRAESQARAAKRERRKSILKSPGGGRAAVVGRLSFFEDEPEVKGGADQNSAVPGVPGVVGGPCAPKEEPGFVSPPLSQETLRQSQEDGDRGDLADVLEKGSTPAVASAPKAGAPDAEMQTPMQTPKSLLPAPASEGTKSKSRRKKKRRFV